MITTLNIPDQSAEELLYNLAHSLGYFVFKKNEKLTPKVVIKIVENTTGISLKTMQGNSTSTDISIARCLAYSFLYKKFNGLTAPRIAMMFLKDPSSVYYALKRSEIRKKDQYRIYYEEINEQINLIKNEA